MSHTRKLTKSHGPGFVQRFFYEESMKALVENLHVQQYNEIKIQNLFYLIQAMIPPKKQLEKKKIDILTFTLLKVIPHIEKRFDDYVKFIMYFSKGRFFNKEEVQESLMILLQTYRRSYVVSFSGGTVFLSVFWSILYILWNWRCTIYSPFMALDTFRDIQDEYKKIHMNTDYIELVNFSKENIALAKQECVNQLDIYSMIIGNNFFISKKQRDDMKKTYSMIACYNMDNYTFMKSAKNQANDQLLTTPLFLNFSNRNNFTNDNVFDSDVFITQVEQVLENAVVKVDAQNSMVPVEVTKSGKQLIQKLKDARSHLKSVHDTIFVKGQDIETLLRKIELSAVSVKHLQGQMEL
jgi:hypothetical protein